MAVGFGAIMSWMLLTLIFGALARIPPLSFAPLLVRLAEIGASALFAWWIIRGNGNALLESFMNRDSVAQSDRVLTLAIVHTFAIATALYVVGAFVVDFMFYIAGSRSPVEVLSRRINGYPPPLHIAVETYLCLITYIDRSRSCMHKRAVKKAIVSIIRFHRSEMILDIDRCVRSFGGSLEDKALYRNRTEAVACRLRDHERKLLDSSTPREVDSVLQEMTSEVESLCVNGWQEASAQVKRDLRVHLAGFVRRVVPAIGLAALGFFYPQLPTVDPAGSGTGAVQATIIAAAIALLFASDLPLDGGVANFLGRRGRGRSERD
ncbi:hypothetical protein GCM10010169_55690 [Micromonospora fulviviridis]|nr:hypothetical protein GCM10010169_55690 [Micromonospora fulviviridis]